MKRVFLLFVASLLFGGMTYAQDYHYGPFDYHDFTRPMIVISRVQFNGEFQNSANIEVAAFVGDELRGRVFMNEPYPNSPIAGQYFAYVPCYYTSTGETYTFKAYDHTTSTEYDNCEVTLIGQDDGYGTVENPIILNFTFEEEPTYGPEYPWVSSANYEGSGMLVVAQIQINGQLVDRATYEVGAFCGDECRGNSNGGSGALLDDWTDHNLGYFAFMNIMGNDDDVINFYLYDLQSNSIFPGMCATTVELVNGGEIGLDILNREIFVLNFVEEQTFSKDIIAYTDDPEVKDHYYLIASPIGEVSPEQVTNMTLNTFDLYSYDQTQELEWINYHNGSYNLLPGTGYLYANSGDGTDTIVTLTFRGYPYSGNGQVTLVKDAGQNVNTALEGWNLVGNPFAETAYINKSFYTMNEGGTNFISNEAGTAIPAMEGIFVIADDNNETLTFYLEPIGKCAKLALNLSKDHGVLDRAIISFGESSLLPKFQINRNSTKLYIPMDGEDYALVQAGEMGEMPVNFKAEYNGSYSINISTEDVNFSYLHLIDNLTGNDVDLLVTPSYSFSALTTDYASRFRLVFATGNSVEGDNFGFINSNGNLCIFGIEGEATLQVIDVTGRILSSETFSGSYEKRLNVAPGVYVLHLINGDNIKSQKMVVKR